VKKPRILSARFRQSLAQGSTVPVLEGPHAVQVEQGNAVCAFKDVIEIGLSSRQGSEFSVDECDTPLLMWKRQVSEEIFQPTAFGQLDHLIGKTGSVVSACKASQWAIEPNVDRDCTHSTSSYRRKDTDLISFGQQISELLRFTVDKYQQSTLFAEIEPIDEVSD
jgi:hypothetical protein